MVNAFIFHKLASPVILLNELSSVASEVCFAQFPTSVIRHVVLPDVEFECTQGPGVLVESRAPSKRSMWPAVSCSTRRCSAE